MKLSPETFEKVKSGEQKFEFRINDEKRKAFRLGERLELARLPDLETSLIVEITSLAVFPTFIDVYRHLPEAVLGFSENDFVNRLYSFYTKDEEQKYGVVAIGIKLV